MIASALLRAALRVLRAPTAAVAPVGDANATVHTVVPPLFHPLGAIRVLSPAESAALARPLAKPSARPLSSIERDILRPRPARERP